MPEIFDLGVVIKRGFENLIKEGYNPDEFSQRFKAIYDEIVSSEANPAIRFLLTIASIEITPPDAITSAFTSEDYRIYINPALLKGLLETYKGLYDNAAVNIYFKNDVKALILHEESHVLMEHVREVKTIHQVYKSLLTTEEINSLTNIFQDYVINRWVVEKYFENSAKLSFFSNYIRNSVLLKSGIFKPENVKKAIEFGISAGLFPFSSNREKVYKIIYNIKEGDFDWKEPFEVYISGVNQLRKTHQSKKEEKMIICSSENQLFREVQSLEDSLRLDSNNNELQELTIGKRVEVNEKVILSRELSSGQVSQKRLEMLIRQSRTIQDGGIGKKDQQVADNTIEQLLDKILEVLSGMASGYVPAGLKICIDKWKKKKMKRDWNKFVRITVNSYHGKKVFSNYNRPSRRVGDDFPSIGFFSRANRAFILVDTSGSMDSDSITTCADIANELNKHNVESQIICWDAAVYAPIKIKTESDIRKALANLKGGGGTVIKPALEDVSKRVKWRDVVFIISDMYISDICEEETKKTLIEISRKTGNTILIFNTTKKAKIPELPACVVFNKDESFTDS
ncbi:VWA domain-containing protein [Caldicellulosiruptor changbaiensis]|uniref:VWA domain-containing protein n=1 Tax=Caldicellulosiruptor changbaiensis TaxID=1222016 RepID=A0A3T0D712_9FIRM|nr:VWA-like domain-containing protein [Caldicellulosiruptor changbaiensis]AZT90911.1 VWA domain-containing protein [Caldicellulosiruptor changbaiensis]